MSFWNILRPFGIIYSLLVLFVVIWYIFSVLVCLDQEKSGNPAKDAFNPLFNFLKGQSDICVLSLFRVQAEVAETFMKTRVTRCFPPKMKPNPYFVHEFETFPVEIISQELLSTRVHM
jgi:hypothetical protein